jgi:Transposase DDE domain
MKQSTAAAPEATPGIHEQLEHLLQTGLQGVLGEEPVEPRAAAGRPRELPSLSLWLAVLVGVLRGVRSFRGIWRLLVVGGLVGLPSYAISDEAVYDRLQGEGTHPLEERFAHLSVFLAQWLRPHAQHAAKQHGARAPFAGDVVALDETVLDPVARKRPLLRQFRKGACQLLPGKLLAMLDVRLQQWRAIEYVAHAKQNGKKHARQMLASLAPGTLILADLGYFGFAWFDELTQAGFWWVSRLREKTSDTVIHTYYRQGETFDGLVWLGAYEAKAGMAVRLVEFRVGATLVRYVTNITDPYQLSMRDIARLYARRWDIELAFLTLKRELGLHLLWSSKAELILIEGWAVLIIAQLVQALRMEVALRAEVDPFEVSLPLLLESLPLMPRPGRDAISECVKRGRALGIIRPSSRLQVQAPQVAAAQLAPLPAPLQLPLRRTPCYRQEAAPGASSPSPAAVPPGLAPPRRASQAREDGPPPCAEPGGLALNPREPHAWTLRCRGGKLVRVPLSPERKVS